MPAYKRVLLKISGEALSGDKGFGFDEEMLKSVAISIKKILNEGVEVAIVVGGGNFFRGRTGKNMDRAQADYIGMLATVMNSLALQSYLEAEGVSTRVQTSIEMRQVAEPYIRRRAIRHLSRKRVVIFSAGTGSPFFSTDTAAALRAVEIGADVLLLAKNVDGVYDSDPAINPNAKKYDKLTYMDVLSQNLKVMDLSAITLCMDNKLPLYVFSLKNTDNMVRVIEGANMGTVIS
ncbi:UMP kinase [Peptoanaerobacter stomatis]|uniref:Uridylate kinase n=1 Tax=Peptoanaerobacter stomatis TaxID=796937 RepID=G9XB18_9FIRM|nr:UMP kinase [Peptoanaerobacter stomatis]EHL09978.1 uridylate kinase [Peptoanaerobacter stomatis]EHL19852.1 uridylate kinase [Peptoanaerobacter stomatis]